MQEKQWHQMMGLGVAGNFAGHLEQAGEASDFVAVMVRDKLAPKAMFPFYVPGHDGQLGVFPVSSDTLLLPEAAISGDEKVQIEPEVALLCQVEYRDGKVSALRPTGFGAYNDCSIRRPNARKISEKKNWGPCSKGLSATLLPIDGLQPGGLLDGYRIACYLQRDGELIPYGVDSAVVDYSYFHGRLVEWMCDKLNHQEDEGPAEYLLGLLEGAGYPSRLLVSIGATRYTDFGEHNFLAPGDVSCVVLYPADRYDERAVQEAIRSRSFPADMSPLIQAVRGI
ncbi:DUF5718 family protein [Aeromonas schubertii]|uniref:Uncharacterized protein n=1 Tax=Aeromonas schubertii TaxID=652 RepID=A0A0S2SD80_9GAMM|nr:DUF5718 family protein [Aeromonas schubertii]ALP39599.1 hypothetical protein WL1483_180 [Aeromonas schubertii]KUE79022.1 hypothetical protein ATO46_06890 [Aeromonas schubertii]